MERKCVRLAPGVELLTEQTKQFKSGLFTVTLAVPLRWETATAYALIPEVLYRGSRIHPDITSLSAATDSLYGAGLEVGVRQRGESQCVCLRCSFIDDRYTFDGIALLGSAVELVAEILLDPLTENGVFDESYVESEGENLADRIESRINDKGEWALFRLVQEMCDGEAYAVDKLGDAQEAVTLTAGQLWQSYRELIDTAQVTFYYNGSAPYEQVEEMVCRVFEPLLTEREMALGCAVIAEPIREVKHVREKMDVTQGKLTLGFRTGGIVLGDPRFPALLVCNAVYGGSGTSKLFANVREKLGLCYSVGSLIDKLKGIMVVTAGVESDDAEAAKEEILKQLDYIRRGEITSRELTAAIRTVAGAILSRKDSQGQMEDDAVTGFSTMGHWLDNDEMIKAVEAVTVEQVAEVAGKIHLDTVYSLVGKGEDL